MRNMDAAVRLGCLLLSASLLAACAAVPKTPTPRERTAGLICTNDVHVGSVLRERKCTTAAEREAERRQSDHAIVIEGVRRGGR